MSRAGDMGGGSRRRKDCLIQARVARELEDALKSEASRRRLSVSHLIRNVLEDAFELVDGVVEDVDAIVQDSVGLAARAHRNAVKIGRSAARGTGASREDHAKARAAEASDEGEHDGLDAIYAWNPVVLNRAARCHRCAAELARGEAAHLGVGSDPGAAPTWLCNGCIAEL